MTTINDLPVELVELVIDYLPHRDTLLHLRLGSRNLNSKTFRRFAKAYFTTSSWKLGISSAKAITHWSKYHDVASNLTSVVLHAPNGRFVSYENIWTAKGISPLKIARAFSVLTQLRKLTLVDFSNSPDLKSAWNFFRAFIPSLYLPKLENLALRDVAIEVEDAVLLLKKHNQTITSIDFHELDLLFTAESNLPQEATPWFDLFHSMKEIKNACAISIEHAKQGGQDAKLQPPWENWDDGEYQYESLTIMETPDDPDDEDWLGRDRHLDIRIRGNETWWLGVKRLAAFNIFNVMQGDEDLEEEDADDMWEQNEIFWDRKTDELLAKKKKLAVERRMRKALLARKQSSEAAFAIKSAVMEMMANRKYEWQFEHSMPNQGR